MADINGAGSATVGGLTAVGQGRREWFTLAAGTPLNGAQAPALQPVLTATAAGWTGASAQVQFQINTTTTFDSPLYDGTDGPHGMGTFSFQAPEPLTVGTTYYWRAKLFGNAGMTTGWTEVRAFRVFPLSGDALEFVDFNVGVQEATNDELRNLHFYAWENTGLDWFADPRSRDVVEFVDFNVGIQQPTLHQIGDLHLYAWEGDVSTHTPTPIIWFLDPSFGRSGDSIKVVGFGFGDLESTYSGVVQLLYPDVGWVTVPVLGWQVYPAQPNAYTPTRVMDLLVGRVDMQHTVIEITVPADAVPPGHPVRVRTDGP